jgi:hypothetical protein
MPTLPLHNDYLFYIIVLCINTIVFVHYHDDMSLRSDKDYLCLVMPTAVKIYINNPTVVFGQHPHT